MNMKLHVVALTAFLLISCSPSEVSPPENLDAGAAFVGVNLVPMDTERVLGGQTVIIRDGRIAAIGPDDTTEVPADTLRIDGNGMYLMPGLAEMHGHIPAPDQPQQFVEDALFLYVANGVTTVRGMQGADGQLDLRSRVNAGDLIGPNLYLAGPSFRGNVVTTPEAAIERVREQSAQGWDLLKVHEGLSVATYVAMAETADAEGIRFGGHVPDDVGLVHAIERGQETIDHLDGYVEYVAGSGGDLDEGRLAEISLSRATRERGWCPPWPSGKF